MNLGLPSGGLDAYHSPSQRVRAATERWGTENFFCVNCNSDRLSRLRAGMPVRDFICSVCSAAFELKSKGSPIGNKIVDAGYGAMKKAIEEDRTPHFFFLHYDPQSWSVRNLFFVPRFAFSLRAIEKRKALSASAQQAGYVGCLIVLGNIPADARIPIISDGHTKSAREVRRRYRRLLPLQGLNVKKRGWTLDVLNALRNLGKKEISIDDAYSLEPGLAALHPGNRNVRPKIRQQLQILRDMDLLEFLGGGRYRLT